jgi:hypothetical protein
MAAIEITREDLTAGDLRAASAKGRDAKVARRMLAIALVRDGRNSHSSNLQPSKWIRFASRCLSCLVPAFAGLDRI